MPDTRVWDGVDPGNEGDFGVAGNFSGDTAPVAGDTIVFNHTSSQSVTSNKGACSFAYPTHAVA